MRSGDLKQSKEKTGNRERQPVRNEYATIILAYFADYVKQFGGKKLIFSAVFGDIRQYMPLRALYKRFAGGLCVSV